MNKPVFRQDWKIVGRRVHKNRFGIHPGKGGRRPSQVRNFHLEHKQKLLDLIRSTPQDLLLL